MVNDKAQIYTIEGIIAGVIMIVTAYLVLSTTTIFTPGDAHITDMQLEQTGNDALAMMDTPDQFSIGDMQPNTTRLSYLIQNNDWTTFNALINYYLNVRADSGQVDRIQYKANLYYRIGDEIKNYTFSQSREMTGRENSVKVTRLVLVDDSSDNNFELEDRKQAVLMEVILWRD
jgi:hypothetical protein